MTDLQETLKLRQAQIKYYQHLIVDKDEILAQATTKLETAQKDFKKTFRHLREASKKLAEVELHIKQLETDIEAQRTPISEKQQILDLVEQMKRLLGE